MAKDLPHLSSAFHTQSIATRDRYWMQRALTLAERAEHEAEVPVGAVLVVSNQVIGEGWNQPITTFDPTAHAEILAVRSAARTLQNYRLPRDSTLYVTLEPCAMCAGALINARLCRLVYGALDPRSGAVVSVFNLLDNRSLNHRVSWEGGCLKEECAQLLQNFFLKRR